MAREGEKEGGKGEAGCGLERKTKREKLRACARALCIYSFAARKRSNYGRNYFITATIIFFSRALFLVGALGAIRAEVKRANTTFAAKSSKYLVCVIADVFVYFETYAYVYNWLSDKFDRPEN